MSQRKVLSSRASRLVKLKETIISSAKSRGIDWNTIEDYKQVCKELSKIDEKLRELKCQ